MEREARKGRERRREGYEARVACRALSTQNSNYNLPCGPSYCWRIPRSAGLHARATRSRESRNNNGTASPTRNPRRMTRMTRKINKHGQRHHDPPAGRPSDHLAPALFLGPLIMLLGNVNNCFSRRDLGQMGAKLCHHSKHVHQYTFVIILIANSKSPFFNRVTVGRTICTVLGVSPRRVCLTPSQCHCPPTGRKSGKPHFP